MHNLTPFIFLTLLPLSGHTSTPSKECVSWFNTEKIDKSKKSCIIECLSLKVDMGTFDCPDSCEDLCQKNNKPPLIGRLIFYPGLTPAEKKLVEINPKNAFIVYRQKQIAEKSTDKYFPNQNLSDESDAYRHYLWAGLVTKELGAKKANLFLDAHEQDPDQPLAEEQMDIVNNRLGQKAALKLIQSKKWSLLNLEKSAIQALHEKRLSILKPGLKIPKEPK